VSFVHIPPPKKDGQKLHSSSSSVLSLTDPKSKSIIPSFQEDGSISNRDSASSTASSYTPSSSFICSRDTIEYISKLQTQSTIPLATDIATIFIEIFSKVPEVKSNKKVAGRFAKKMETVVRTLCHKGMC
jgi:hypothetical protein